MSSYSCEYCDKHFKSNSALRRHAKKNHPDELMPISRRQKKLSLCDVSEPSVSAYSCAHCTKRFSQNCSLRRHIKTVHPDKDMPQDRRVLSYQMSERSLLKIPLHFDNIEGSLHFLKVVG